jgi:hypothetical protein
MFTDQFARVIETMCAAANLIPFVAPDDCGHSLLTDTCVPDHYHPVSLNTHATCRALFHGLCSFIEIQTSLCHLEFALA